MKLSYWLFEWVVGLKQSEILSPVVFSMLLEDLELFLQDDPLCCLNIGEILLVIVLFTDDMILFLNCSINLQHMRDMLKSYCDRWGQYWKDKGYGFP